MSICFKNQEALDSFISRAKDGVSFFTVPQTGGFMAFSVGEGKRIIFGSSDIFVNPFQLCPVDMLALEQVGIACVNGDQVLLFDNGREIPGNKEFGCTFVEGLTLPKDVITSNAYRRDFGDDGKELTVKEIARSFFAAS